jgi:hypothetical protein
MHDDLQVTRESLINLASAALDDLLKSFSLERLDRLRDPVTWSEEVDDNEVQFEVLILERNAISILVAVSATATVTRSQLLGITGPSVIVDRRILR